MKEAMEGLKTQYTQAQDRMEAEQNTIMQLRRDTGELKKSLSELEGRNRTLAVNAQQQESMYRQKLDEITSSLSATQAAAEVERAAKEDAIAAVRKLENVINIVREEMIEAQEASENARRELMAERNARVDAEESTQTLRNQLMAISDAEQEARAEAQKQLGELQNEFEAAKAMLVEIQAAKPAAKKTTRTRKPKATADAAAEEVVSSSDDEGTPAVANGKGEEAAAEDAPKPKRRGRPAKAKAEAEPANAE